MLDPRRERSQLRGVREDSNVNGISPAAPAMADLFIIGGGINGCGIARDAAGRGLSVVVA